MNTMTDPAYHDATVFLIDDDDRIRTSLARALLMRGFKVQSFSSAEEFLENYSSNDPGCLVLDYGMPGLNGLDLQKRLLAQKTKIPIIFISGHAGVPESVQAMKAGAVDFLEKPFRQSTFLACIQTAFEADLKTRNSELVASQAHKKFSQLTAREREIAQFMIENPSNTASKEVGRALNISPRTVDHHRASVLRKMQINSVAELIDLSVSAGLLQSESR